MPPLGSRLPGPGGAPRAVDSRFTAPYMWMGIVNRGRLTAGPVLVLIPKPCCTYGRRVTRRYLTYYRQGSRPLRLGSPAEPPAQRRFLGGRLRRRARLSHFGDRRRSYGDPYTEHLRDQHNPLRRRRAPR